MSRRYYTEFVNHCLRFYARFPEPVFRTNAAKLNWEACKTVLDTYSDNDRDIVLSVYSMKDTLSDNVYTASVERSVTQVAIWNLLEATWETIAKERGLI